MRRFYAQLYGSFFQSIVFYGPTADHDYNIVCAKKTPGYFGDYQHYVITQATVEFPGYDGYLWVADDLLFNFRKVFPILDPSKLWMVYGYYGHQASPNIFENRTDWHWPKAFGLPAVRSLYQCIPKVYMNRSEQWFGGPNRVTFSLGDFGYIPRRFVEDFRILSYSLRYVFMEITLPTAFFLMSKSQSDIQVLSNRKEAAIWLWDERRLRALDSFSNHTIFLHPVKLHGKPVLQSKLLDKLDDVWSFRTKHLKVPWLHC